MTTLTEAGIRAADAMVNYDGPEVNPAVWHRRELLRLLDEARAELAAPEYQCRDCGSTGPFTTVKYDYPGEPVDYDLECQNCKSTQVADSPLEVFNSMEIQLENVRAERDKWQEEARRYCQNADHWRAEAEANRRDAERYRWLRILRTDHTLPFICRFTNGASRWTGAHADTAVDQAMQEPGRD